jgi:RNA polymerase sigma factor for flagellar operon FliA
MDDRAGGVSLVDTLGDERSQDPAGSMEAAETKFLLSRAIEQLSERERIVVVLYYYEGMTLAEIGRVLGVTESRISQMHTAAMLRLRTRLLDAERV